MKNYNTFELLKQMNYPRVGGSSEEEKLAKFIKSKCSEIGVKATIETFDLEGYKISKAELTASNGEVFNVEGVGLSGSTPNKGVTARPIYITSVNDAKIKDVKGCIVILHSKLANYQVYKILCEKGAVGLVLSTGSVYDDNSYTDLDPYPLRERHYKNGKIPSVIMTILDCQKLINNLPDKLTLTLIQEEFKNESRNVVATIPGESDEVVAFTAHYDSISYSNGMYDNATGSIAILELLNYFNEFKPKRTLKFIWCGSEELGLLGSKAYVLKHKKKLNDYKLCINIDMVGVTIGEDIAVCSSNKSLVHFIKYLGFEVGFPISVKQGVYSSDSTPFADNEVPAVSFARIAPPGGALIHSKKDVLINLDDKNYYDTMHFIKLFSSKLVNSVCFPVESEIPQNIKDELDIYTGRKEKK
ncbi:MAG: M28 family peptidase [Anaeroplasmataceae bacterium]